MQNNPLPQKTHNSRDTVEAFKTKNEIVLKKFYQENFKNIQCYIIKNNGTEQQAKDIYQEAFIIIWQNIKNDKFQPESTSSINGYLYTIAKNKWMDYLRSNQYKKTVNSDSFQLINISEDVNEKIVDDKLHTNRLEKGMKAFNNLGSSCKELLTKFYFENKSMNQIAEELELDSASTRNKKYRCMMKLRELALK